MDQQVREFFQQYERANATSDVTAIGGLYADNFMFCGPKSTQTVKKEDFVKVLPKMKAHFSAMGLSDSQLETVEASALDSKYVLAKVGWKMTLRTSQGNRRIDALATYVLARNEDALAIVVQIDHQDLAAVVAGLEEARP